MREVETEEHRLSLHQLLAAARKTWHGVKLEQPDWSPSSHSIALSAHLPEENQAYHFMLNAY
jgi:isoamylase